MTKTVVEDPEWMGKSRTGKSDGSQDNEGIQATFNSGPKIWHAAPQTISCGEEASKVRGYQDSILGGSKPRKVYCKREVEFNRRVIWLTSRWETCGNVPCHFPLAGGLSGS